MEGNGNISSKTFGEPTKDGTVLGEVKLTSLVV